MGSVPFVIGGIIISIGKVPAVNVIDVSVAIVVNAVIGNFLGVGPNGILECRVRKIYSRINDGNDDRLAHAGFYSPSLLVIDKGRCQNTVKRLDLAQGVV